MNIGQMMRQVQDVQGKMSEMQNRLAEAQIVGQSGGGAVVVNMNGKAEISKIKIDPKVVSADDVEMLEDLIVAACNDAKEKAEKHIAGETEKIMGGLKLPPGVKLPF